MSQALASLRVFVDVLGQYRKFLFENNQDTRLISFVDNLLREIRDVRDEKKAENLILKIQVCHLSDFTGHLFRHWQGAAKDLTQAEFVKQKLISQLKKADEAIRELQRPPHSFAVFELLEDRGEGEFWTRLREGETYKSAMAYSEEVVERLKNAEVGQYVRLNEEGVIVEVLDAFDSEGSVEMITELLLPDRVRLKDGYDEERVVTLASGLRGLELKIGDQLLVSRNNLAVELFKKPEEVDDLLLRESPNVSWSNIGGLDAEIKLFRDEIESNIVYPEIAKLFELPNPKGILLSGPPGCGKTLFAKAAVTEMAAAISSKTGREIKGYYILVGGPAAVLNEYVGRSPKNVQAIFKEARKKAKDGSLVFVIFDEFESLFTVRQHSQNDGGVSKQLVNQINDEMDGIEQLDGVVVIGLTNRADLIDPAVIRPGRFNLKIAIPRPNQISAAQILAKYIKDSLPYHKTLKDMGLETISGYLVDKIVERCFDASRQENQLLDVHYEDGGRELFSFSDFLSGAMLDGIVTGAKKKARNRYVEADDGGKKLEGLLLEDFYESIDETLRNEINLPGVKQAQEEWLMVEGRKGRGISRVDQLYSMGAKTTVKKRRDRS